MDLQEFLETTTGNWFAQRTIYLLDQGQCNNNKAELSIEKLNLDAPEVRQLCQENGLSLSSKSISLKTSWDNSVDWGQPKEKGSSILVFIPDENNEKRGKIASKINKIGAKTLAGTYIFSEDESLTLITENGDEIIEERQSFASPNLRLRSSICKQGNDHKITSFYSEIRRMEAKK
jgi:phycoerythrin-associated linker protein